MLDSMDKDTLPGLVARLHDVQQAVKSAKRYDPTPEEIGRELSPKSSTLMARVMALRGKTAASRSDAHQKYETARQHIIDVRRARLEAEMNALEQQVATANRRTDRKLNELEDAMGNLANDDEKPADEQIFGTRTPWVASLPGYPRPFDIMSYDASSGAVVLVTGNAERRTALTTTYIAPSSNSVTVGAGQQYVWMDVDRAGGTGTLVVGGSKPTNTYAHPKKLLWEFYDKIPIKCWHRGNWDIDQELPTPTTLYMVLAVREYDENGTIVAVGSESYPSLATGHFLAWTEDWARIGEE